MDEPVELHTLISHLTCRLCSGYLIEAATIVECLHTFCKSCIVKYLDDNNKCPECQQLIHQSHPLSYVMIDRKMQDIVYKAVPGLQAREENKIREFYRLRNLPVPEGEAKAFKATPVTDGVKEEESSQAQEPVAKGADCNYHRDDTQVSICMLEGENLPALKKKFLHCSVYTTIKTLKRYISKNIYGCMDKHNTLDIFCQKELMGKDHSLEFVLATRWRTKNLPLQLEYRERVDML